MKTISIIIILLTYTLNVTAQKKAEVQIKTSAECEKCQETIQYYLSHEKGVLNATLDLNSKILTVKYNAGKTTPEKIRKAVTLAGYDADDMPADTSAYEKLKACCKKGGHGK